MLGPRARTEAAAPVLRFLREAVQPEKLAATQQKSRRRPESSATVTGDRLQGRNFVNRDMNLSLTGAGAGVR